jgi:hypothetical protein
MNPRYQDDELSERRISLHKERNNLIVLSYSLIRWIGCVDLSVTGNFLIGVLSVGSGYCISKEPSNFQIICAIVLNSPFAFIPSRENRTSFNTFIVALRLSCIFFLLRVLFLGRRLKQLGEISKLEHLKRN